jgi:fructose-specific phosphotransferase system IIC component
MSGHGFVVVLVIGAAGLALWFDHRFGRLAPGDIRKTMFHVLAALIAINVVVRGGLAVTLVPGDVARTMLGIFGIALPGLVYSFLVGVWVIRRTQEAFSRYSH